MKPNPLFNRVENLSRTLNQLRSMVTDQVQDDDTAADLCDVIDYCITMTDRCMTSVNDIFRLEANLDSLRDRCIQLENNQ